MIVLLLALVLALAGAVVAFLSPRGVRLLLIVGAPVLAAIVTWIALQLHDPDPGCTVECYGRLIYVVIAVVMLAGTEIGLIVGSILGALEKGRRPA